jgi:acyl-CoA hydrolase
MDFVQPIHVGEVVTLRASVNDVGRTSLEVGVRVDAENVRMADVKHVASAYLVYVALDDAGNPTPVPPLRVETDEDRRRQHAARARRAARRRTSGR